MTKNLPLLNHRVPRLGHCITLLSLLFLVVACQVVVSPLPQPEPQPRTNQAPSVAAGADLSLALGEMARLEGKISDDGLPASGTGLTVSWQQVSGPGTVSFDNAASAITTASFSAAGIYELQLSASDGALTSSDALEVTVVKEGVPLPEPATSFSIVALPDTQGYTCVGDDGDGCGGSSEIYNAQFEAQTEWIVANLAARNIAFVTHKGDVVDNASRQVEWDYADAAMAKLDGRVPYSVTMGDHDYYPEEFHDGDTSLYEQYFGPGRYDAYRWYGGASPNGHSHYQLFDAGGFEFLHIALEWEAPSAALAWAQGVLDANKLPTIITTHAYLWDNWDDAAGAGHSTLQEACLKNGSSDTRCEDPGDSSDASTGEEIFENLVKPNPQIFMVLSGHYAYAGRRSSNPNVSGCDISDPNYDANEANFERCDNGEYHQVSTNDAGQKVYEMLANYQSYANGGDAWLRVIEFTPGGGANGQDRISIETYSPTLGRSQTDSASRFSFDLDFEQRFAVTAQ